MRITKDNIWDEIEKKNYLEVLNSDIVDKVKDDYGQTPLHHLALKGVKGVLQHPFVDKVKDTFGNTPLLELAYKGVKEVLDHPSVDKVKNNVGKTPLHLLARYCYLTIEDLRKKYPWYKKEIKNIYKAVKEIVNTPRSIQFILENS